MDNIIKNRKAIDEMMKVWRSMPDGAEKDRKTLELMDKMTELSEELCGIDDNRTTTEKN